MNGIRSLHGNSVLHKDDFARGLLKAMHRGDTVGILMDTNMTPPQGVFRAVFSVWRRARRQALRAWRCTPERAVLPGFLAWHDDERKYVLHFGEELQLVKSGDNETRHCRQHGTVLRRRSSVTFGSIRNSGSGCTGVGRPAPRARRVCTDADSEDHHRRHREARRSYGHGRRARVLAARKLRRRHRRCDRLRARRHSTREGPQDLCGPHSCAAGSRLRRTCGSCA